MTALVFVACILVALLVTSVIEAAEARTSGDLAMAAFTGACAGVALFALYVVAVSS